MDDIFKNTSYRILEIFIKSPKKDFSIRGIARELEINHATVINHIYIIKEKGLIKENKNTLYKTFYANTENEEYIFYKKNYILYKIKMSGMIEYIQKKTLASSIILFGSCAKGTFSEDSDIDIFVESEKINMDLSIYEKYTEKKVNLLFEMKINDLPDALKTNIMNGTIMYGYINIKNARKNGL